MTGTAVQGHVSRGGQASVARLEFAAMAGGTAIVVRETLGTATEPDDDVHQRVTTAVGSSPAPTIEAADCSCRARSDRCVHILATLYALAAAIDHRPTLALELQAFHRTTSTASTTEPGALPTRWIPLAGLGIRGYWEPIDS